VLTVLLPGCLYGDSDERIGTVEQALQNPIVPVKEDAGALLEPAYDPFGDPPGIVQSYAVKHDNPVVGGDFLMPFSSSIVPGAERTGNAWVFHFFDVEVEYWDTEPPAHRRASWPQADGAWFRDTVLTFPWESHGLHLDPNGAVSASKVKLFEDDWQNPDVSYVKAHFHLHADVAVVPVRTIVLHGPGTPGTPNQPALSSTRFPPLDARLLWDDDWKHGSKQITNSPGYSPEQVVTSWEYRPGCTSGVQGCLNHRTSLVGNPNSGRYFQPDRVFDQCNVQFREISYQSCAVPHNILYNTSCNDSSFANTVRSHVEKNCGVPLDTSIKVVFLGRLTRWDCANANLFGGSYANYVFMTEIAYPPIILHELGHQLNLDHVTPCSPQENIMCAPPQQGVPFPRITPDDCVDAHAAAQALHNGWW